MFSVKTPCAAPVTLLMKGSNTMRKAVAFLLTAVLMLSLFVSPAFAAANILNIISAQTKPWIYVSIQGQMGGSRPVFYTPDDREMPILQENKPTEHLIVIDHSAYYSDNITIQSIRSMVTSYLNLLPESDLVRFIYSDEPNKVMPYESVQAAIARVSSLAQVSNPSLLSEAISVATREALAFRDGDFTCRAVAVIANPYNLTNLNVQKPNTNIRILMTVIYPNRKAWYDTVISDQKRQMYNNSVDLLSKLANVWNGRLVVCQHSGQKGNEKLDVSAFNALSGSFSNLRNYTIDASLLAHSAKSSPPVQTFTIKANIPGSGLATAQVDVPLSVLPQLATPTTSPTSTPTIRMIVIATPTPSPTPIPIIVAKDQEGAEWRVAMRRLQALYYLDKDHFKFDEESQLAYDKFCEQNGYRISNGIPADVYADLINTSLMPTLVPNSTATPVPATATPIPMAVVNNDSNPAWHEIMELLIELKYLEGSHATFDAEAQLVYERFCTLNGLARTEGVTQAAYEYIINNRASLIANPIEVTPEPIQIAVEMNQGGVTWIRAMTALQELYYLEGDHPTFDAESQQAYLEFCQNNWIDPSDSIPQEVYNMLVNDTQRLVKKATPTPAPTATPEPTVPVTGMHIGDSDTSQSGGFINQLQQRLSELNCYAKVNGVDSYEPGVFDQATLNAITAYCETYNVTNTEVNGATYSVINTILHTKQVPRATPTMSFGEKVRAILTQPLFMLGSFQVLMWMALTLCAVLIIGIVIIIILMRRDKKNFPLISSAAEDASKSNQYEPIPSASSATSIGTMSSKTLPLMGKSVNLKVDYQSRTWNITAQFDNDYTMGRENCDLTLDPSDVNSSRRHAKLVWVNGQLYVQDMNSTCGTFVNGQQIASSQVGSFSASSKTQILDQPANDSPAGYMLNNGDVIRLSKHYITVTW